MAGFNRAELQSYAQSQRPEYEHVLKEIVEIPSVSVEPQRKAEVHRAAEYAVSLLESVRRQGRALRDQGPSDRLRPLRPRAPGLPTVTVYNHLDVQPAEGPDWKTSPFSFVRQGDRYFGRGTTDDKGPAITALFGARYAFQNGVPVNIHFLWELEEEIGSPHFETDDPRQREGVRDRTRSSSPTRSGSRASARRPRRACAGSRASASTSRPARPTSTPARPAARRAIR